MISYPTDAEERNRELYFPSYYFFADKRLKNHRIKTVHVMDLDFCELLCYQHDDCVSFNIKRDPDSATGQQECELNNSTHMEHDGDLMNDNAYIYRGAKESKKDILFSATVQGLRSLKESSEERRKLRDTANAETIDRILNAAETNTAEELKWHKSCYAKYNDKEEKGNELKQSLEKSVQSKTEGEFLNLLALLSSGRYRELLPSFIAVKKEKNPNLQYWLQYMEMVLFLLLFIRAQREGIWDLHLYAFHKMLPFFHRYDHTNYARWGPVYLAQMKQLPEEDFDRIDVTFDRYRESSIKCATRKKRSRGHAPIRRVFEDGSVPLPKAWSTFLALDENKVDLTRFLPENLIAGAPADKIIIVGGGFEEEDTVKCSRSNIDIRGFKGFHEEADTRMILHCVHLDAEFLVVSSQDTDVFLLLVSHFDKMSCKQLWSLAPEPESCDEMVNCGCKSGWKSKKCSCRSVGLPCTGACKCRSAAESCCQNNNACGKNPPCYNNATCQSGFTDKGYRCLCTSGFAGEHCKKQSWKKINNNPVCFGARRDTYGTFNIKENGLVHTFKLVHKSGSLRCNPDAPASYWGCDNTWYGDKRLLTVITHPNKTALLLADYLRGSSSCKYYSYQIAGIGVNSPELVFNKLPTPMSVSVDQEFHIWYGQDLKECSEDNNSGETCADVYAWYA
ncbi:hypothetical protein ACROYT_G023330 [Oculina patagonica]